MFLGDLTRNAVRLMKVAAHVDRRALGRRLTYEVARRTGWYKRRYPAGELDDWLEADGASIYAAVRDGRRFLWGPRRDAWRDFYRRRFSATAPIVVEQAERIVRGELQYFFHQWHDSGGLPDWRANPFTGQVVGERHWSELGFFSPDYGDLKFILEPSRAAWAFSLVRAYWHTDDEHYAQAFWRLVEDWGAKNPPQAGPLWVCGQESALRLVAWSFGLFGFGHSIHTTQERVALLSALIAAHADRIEGTMAYAKSQRNNHALNEAVGLWTCGILYPELRQASRWRDAGRRELGECVRQQIYDDGTYIQHSLNYHRVMLQSLAWAIGLGRSAGEPLDDEISRRLGLGAKYLHQMIDPRTGRAPNLGSNDGALVLPLSSCDFSDFRPSLTAATRVASGEQAIASGPWDEEAFWLCGPFESSDANAATEPVSSSFPVGGYDTLRGRESWALCRAASYRDRPSQCDQLHVDLWWRGRNVARDAGTYLYNSPPPWNNSLAETRVHNTVVVDERDQMTRVGRFWWIDWAQANVEHKRRSARGYFESWQAWHDGYRRLRPAVGHRRGVLRIGAEHWLVVDSLTSDGEHDYRLHWLLEDCECDYQADDSRLTLQLPVGAYALAWGSRGGPISATLVRADDWTTRGWQSPYYGFKEPALSLAVTARQSHGGFWTVFGPAPLSVTAGTSSLCLEIVGAKVRIDLATDELGWRLDRACLVRGDETAEELVVRS